MKRQDIDSVCVEMDRLRERIDAIKESHSYGQGWGALTYVSGNHESAAIRRASMDLTRALARLRGN